MSVINLDPNKAHGQDSVKEEPEKTVVTGAELKDSQGVAVMQDGEEGKEMMIKMDGPLSKIYTDALNVYLAKEHLSNIQVATEQMMADCTFLIKSIEDKQKQNLYVYSLNVDDLVDQDDYAEEYDKFAVGISEHEDFDKVVVLEAINVRGAKLNKMYNYAKRNGAKVFQTRKVALEYIQGKLYYIASKSIGQEDIVEAGV